MLKSGTSDERHSLLIHCRHMWDCLLGIVYTESHYAALLWDKNKSVVTLGGGLAQDVMTKLAGVNDTCIAKYIIGKGVG